MNNMTIKEATELWINRDMTAVPMSVIEKLWQYSDYNDFNEITPVMENSTVWSNEYQTIGKVIEIAENDDGDLIATVDFEEEQHEVPIDDLSIEEDNEHFPMWGTMWAFTTLFDADWLEDEENIRIMAECGFRIYESEDYGYIFGIDGAGYDFYTEHWIPLYKARGLKWHDKED